MSSPEMQLWDRFVVKVQEQFGVTPRIDQLQWSNLFSFYCFGYQRALQVMTEDLEKSNAAMN